MTIIKRRGEDLALEQLEAQLGAEGGDNTKLIENIQDNPFCTLQVLEAVPCLYVSWKSYVTSNQLRYIHEKMLELIKLHSLHKILGDDTALQSIHHEDQKWITENWMPRAIKAGLKAGASKNSNFYFGKLSTDHIRLGAPQGLEIRAFDQLQEAQDWLTSYH